LPRIKILPEGNLIKVSLSNVPALAVIGGAVSVALPKRQEIIVVHLQENEFLALSPVCSHRGCIVRKVRDGFECPCHGSRYDQYGEVIEGPAPRALTRYATELKGTELLIRYQS
jgi:Rieske Fe-S protein